MVCTIYTDALFSVKGKVMAFIEWVILATGEQKKTRAPMELETAHKLCRFLNKPSSQAIYTVKPIEL